MAYDSEEQKKLAQSIAEKTERARELFKDEATRAQFLAALDQVNETLKMLQEKQKYEELSVEEVALLEQMANVLHKALPALNDAKLLLGNSIMVAATTQFYHVKKLAEEGNEEAKRQYEKLLPLFKNAMDPRSDGNQHLN